jgi:hypothetical protein
MVVFTTANSDCVNCPVKWSDLFIIGQFVDILGGMLGGVVGSSALRDFRATEAVCETLTAIGSMKQVPVVVILL